MKNYEASYVKVFFAFKLSALFVFQIFLSGVNKMTFNLFKTLSLSLQLLD